jgi:TetR/AcrR family transcriptional regulator, transcriptional repressor for nem operon
MTTTKSTTPPSPTAKPRDGKTTREAILSAAMRLMHVHGYNATSLDDVLRESGVGKGNFYYHFRSKEDLGYAILDQLADPGTPPLAQIRCFLDRIVQAQRDRQCRGGCAMGNLALELSDVHEGFRKRLASVFTTWHERIAETLAEAKRRGHVAAACDPESSARFLVASLEGSILLGKVSKDIEVMEQCVRELKRYLTAYEVPA